MAIKKIYTDLEVSGKAAFTGIVSGSRGVQPNEFTTKSQVEEYEYLQKDPAIFIDSVNIGGTYIDKGTEEVVIAAVNDASLGGFHGLVYVDKHKSLYASSRSVATKAYRFPDVADLTTYTEIDISVAGYAGGTEDIVYDEVKDKLYCVMADNGATLYGLKVWEIDPITMAATLVIDYNTVDKLVVSPTFLAFGGFLYIGTNDYNALIYKFDLADYSLDTSAVVGSTTNGLHNIMSDGKKLYVSSTFEWGSGSQVARIHKDTLVVEETIQIPLVGVAGAGGFTDDGVVVGDYIYIGTEAQTRNSIYRFNKNDLTDNISIEVLTQNDADDFWAITFEGDRLWYSGQNGTFGSLDINTLENVLYTSPFTNSINEMVLNGRQLLVAGFDVYPVTGTGYIGRTGAPYIAETLITLSINGKQPMQNVIPANTWLIQKADGNFDLSALETGDFVRGQRSATIFWESAKYLGGDEAQDTNWTVYNSFNI